jgi:dihydroorotate dehydrogenase (fumarate)
MEQAGADALELNIYYMPTDLEMTAQKVEEMYFDLVSHVKASVRVPVSVKLGPFFTAFASFATRMDAAGADGLVLFNRFYQPDFDLEALEVVPNLVLSDSHELRLRLHWTALLYNRIRPDLAITGGVHTAEDVIKGVMSGARCTMLTSALLRHGIPYLEKLEEDLVDWMEEHEYESIRQMRGSMSSQSVAEPAAFERANYMKVLNSYSMGLPVR